MTINTQNGPCISGQGGTFFFLPILPVLETNSLELRAFCAILYRRGRFIKNRVRELRIILFWEKITTEKPESRVSLLKPERASQQNWQKEGKSQKNRNGALHPGSNSRTYEYVYVNNSKVMELYDTWYFEVSQSCVYFRSGESGYILRTQATAIYRVCAVYANSYIQQEEQNIRQPSRMPLNSNTAIQQS